MVLNDQKLAKLVARISLDQHLCPYNYTPPDLLHEQCLCDKKIYFRKLYSEGRWLLSNSLWCPALFEEYGPLGHSAVPVPHSSLLFRDLLHLTCKFFLYNLITVNMKQSMFKVLWCFLNLKRTLTKKDTECRTCKKSDKLDIFQDWKLFLCERQASVWERMVSIHIPARGTQSTACEELLKPANKKWSNLIWSCTRSLTRCSTAGYLNG